MLFYMQMRNWFIIFVILTMTYMIHQKMNTNHKVAPAYRMSSLSSISLFR